MATLTKPEAIEAFHLALLQAMPQHLPHSNYAIKGGANLRLFLGSVRRSEDIDFNFVGRTNWSLQPRMEGLLSSPALRALLSAQGMKIDSVNPSKTTETTGRWKFQMSAPGLRFSSKIEFSMRDDETGAYRLDSVSPELAAAARIRPATANHYLPTAAVEQKLIALARRSETQARDIFDLDHLFVRFPVEAAAAQISQHDLESARRRVFDTTYRDYLDLVVTYLDPAFVSMYDNEAEWERMSLHVATQIDEMGRSS